MNQQLPAAPLLIDSDSVDLAELWRTLVRYRTHILGVAVVFAMIGVLVAFSLEPVFRATTTLMVEARPAHAIQVQEVYDPGYGTDDYFATQTELLRSRQIVGKVVDKLDLANSPEILPPPEPPTLWQRLWSGQWLPFVSVDEPAQAAIPPELKRELAVDAVLGLVTVSPVFMQKTYRATTLMRVSVDSRSPALAASITNALGEAYVDSGLESRLDATERATRWLTQRLGDLRTSLENSEHALQAYLEKHKLVNIGGARSLYEEDVVDNARKLREAQRKKTELASTYWKIRQAGDDDAKLRDIGTLTLDPNVQKAGDNRLQAQQAVKQLEERYGAKHPQMTAARARLDAAIHAYHGQLRTAANGVRAEYEIAAETERALQGVVQSGKEQIRKLDQSDYQLKALTREVDSNRELYDLFLKRYKETDTTSTYEPLNARIVDRAVVPRFPYKPNRTKVMTLWALAGLLMGLILAALRHLLSENIRSPEQLEQATQLPVLSVLPLVSGLGRKISAPAMAIEHPRAPFSEGVRSIRASLYLSDVDKRIKRVMFTSALPKEGKSSLASSFAAILGQTERVILVDADLRAPALKRIFGIGDDRPGIVELLTGQATLQQATFHHEASKLDVLPVAQVPPNPAEIVASAAFQKLIDTLSSQYDRVVFDTPPCHVASDSLLLAQRMDAVLFVIHGGSSALRTIQAAIRHLRGAQAPLLGHVLNQVDAHKAYGEYGAYGYGPYGQHGQYGK